MSGGRDVAAVIAKTVRNTNSRTVGDEHFELASDSSTDVALHVAVAFHVIDAQLSFFLSF